MVPSMQRAGSAPPGRYLPSARQGSLSSTSTFVLIIALCQCSQSTVRRPTEVPQVTGVLAG